MMEHYSNNFFIFQSNCTYDELDSECSSLQSSNHSASSTITHSTSCTSLDGNNYGTMSPKNVKFASRLEEVFAIPDKSDRMTYIFDRKPLFRRAVSFRSYTDIYLIPTSDAPFPIISQASFPMIPQESSFPTPINRNATNFVATSHFQSSKLSQPKQFRKSSPYKRRNSMEADRLPQLVV